MNIGMTNHTKLRLKQRSIDGFYIKTQLSFIPYSEGKHIWKIPNKSYSVVYADHDGVRTIITVFDRLTKG